MRRSFERRVAAWLDDRYPERVRPMGEARVLALIRQGVEKASGHGIHTEQDVAVFLGLMVRWGADFDQRDEGAWAAAVLRGPGLSGGAKLRWIEGELERRSL
jgi:hypothetical protein